MYERRTWCWAAMVFVVVAIGCGGGSKHPADAPPGDGPPVDSPHDAVVDSPADAALDAPAGSADEITDFKFLAANNAGLAADAHATILSSATGTDVSVAVPYGTAVTALVATFTTTGTKVSVGPTVQTSGVTANNFSSTVTYTVTAVDGSTRDYAVTVTTTDFVSGGVFATGNSSRYSAVGDFNADGKPDLAVPNLASSTVSVLLDTTASGATTATFAPKLDLAAASGPIAAAIADLDGDGKPDLAVTNYNANTVSVFINTTATGATTPSFANRIDLTTGTGPFAIAIVDINGDGKRDLVVTDTGTQATPDNKMSVLLNMTTAAGTPTFAAKSDFTVAMIPTSVTSADFNGDGKPDLAFGFYQLAQVSILLNTTATGVSVPTFATQVDLAQQGYSFWVTSGDLDGDGRPDLAATTEDQAIWTYVNTTATGAAAASFGTPVFYRTRYYSFHLAIGNVDSDPRPDIVVVGDGDGVQLLGNRTSSMSALTLLPPFDFPVQPQPYASAIADFNGDSKPDLAITDTGGVEIMLAR
ncbi:MAG: VCBS repeat-containing protein [Deltaproteobacteria bacterium]|nr:VCBS repeat-containing protein [Deltaproteobacteria bacterium]